MLNLSINYSGIPCWPSNSKYYIKEQNLRHKKIFKHKAMDYFYFAKINSESILEKSIGNWNRDPWPASE